MKRFAGLIQSVKNDSGSIMVMLFLFVLIAGFAIALLVQLNSQESQSSVKTKRRGFAYQMASTGIQRSVWLLKNDPDNWNTIISSGYIAGYANDTQYNDLSGGTYIVNISSFTNDEFIAVATAKDYSQNEFRALQAHIKRTQVVAPLHGYGIGTSTSPFTVTAHWGPIISVGQLILNSIDINQLYPQKFSETTITASSNTSAGPQYASRVTSPNPPLSDNEFNGYNNVPPVPSPDLEYYLGTAQSGGCPLLPGGAGNWTQNGCYYKPVNSNGWVDFDDTIDTQPYTRYIDGNCSIGISTSPNSFMQGKLFVMGNLTITGTRTSPTMGGYPALGSNNYPTNVPPNACQQYQKNNPKNKNANPGVALTGNPDEYPGKGGGLCNDTTFTFLPGICPGFQCCSSCDDHGGRLVAFKGAVYVKGTLSGSATNPQVIHGALILPQANNTGSGLFDVFYDTSVALQTTTEGIYASSVTEISPTPF